MTTDVTRRGFIAGLGAVGLAMPAVVAAAANIMPVRPVPIPLDVTSEYLVANLLDSPAKFVLFRRVGRVVHTASFGYIDNNGVYQPTLQNDAICGDAPYRIRSPKIINQEVRK